MSTIRFAFTTAACAAFAATAAAQDKAPDLLELRGTVRDFRERTVEEGGHPDFERRPAHGFGHYVGNIAPYLGEDRKPVFTGNGAKVREDFRDAEGRPICPFLFNEDLGDVRGELGEADTGGIESAASFHQWYNEVLGVNMSESLTLTLVRQADGTYVFDDAVDPEYQALDGFFPIDDKLLGNPGGSPDRNFHFTFELNTTFVYDEDVQQTFKFIGDDDVWVFINGRLVIDLGGVHSARMQFVDLSRLDLQDGQEYTLDFFFAERHRTQSNFRIVTNIQLDDGDEMPEVTAIFD